MSHHSKCEIHSLIENEKQRNANRDEDKKLEQQLHDQIFKKGATAKITLEKDKGAGERGDGDKISISVTFKEADKCENCGKAKEGLKKCARCLQVFYCSKECQVAHFPRHKVACKKKDAKRDS